MKYQIWSLCTKKRVWLHEAEGIWSHTLQGALSPPLPLSLLVLPLPLTLFVPGTSRSSTGTQQTALLHWPVLTSLWNPSLHWWSCCCSTYKTQYAMEQIPDLNQHFTCLKSTYSRKQVFSRALCHMSTMHQRLDERHSVNGLDLGRLLARACPTSVFSWPVWFRGHCVGQPNIKTSNLHVHMDPHHCGAAWSFFPQVFSIIKSLWSRNYSAIYPTMSVDFWFSV